ncbi:MAG TPA: HAD-IA family hydrolase, partial [Kineosporiaceae bacterium]|nr:HAD-IA family hydrolase [Kineosporiaceae bacterium]
WAADHGITDPDVAQRWAAISEVYYTRYQRRELTFAGQRRWRVREFLGVDVDDAEADALFARYRERYEAGWSVFDDAVPVLRRARAAGLTVAVLTNGDEDQSRLKIMNAGLSGEIDTLVATSRLPASKPDLRAFADALNLVGVAAKDALMVGDSLEKDVRGALAAGWDAVLLDRSDLHRGVDVPRVRSLDALTFDPPCRYPRRPIGQVTPVPWSGQ